MESLEKSYAILTGYCHNIRRNNHDLTFLLRLMMTTISIIFFMVLEQCIRGLHKSKWKKKEIKEEENKN